MDDPGRLKPGSHSLWRACGERRPRNDPRATSAMGAPGGWIRRDNPVFRRRPSMTFKLKAGISTDARGIACVALLLAFRGAISQVLGGN